MNKLIEFFVQKSAFVNLITVAVLLAGIIALGNTKREAFPNIDFDIVSITTVYRGAAPTEVEQLITKYLEDEIRSVDGIKSVISSSLESRSAITVTLDPNFKNKRKVVQDLKDAKDRAKLKFPAGIDDPIFTEITSSRSPIIEIAMNFEKFTPEQLKAAEALKKTYFTSKKITDFKENEIQQIKDQVVSAIIAKEKFLSKEDKENAIKVRANETQRLLDILFRPAAAKTDELALRFLSKQLKDRLELIGDVSAVTQRGYRDREVHVEIDPDKLSYYNISADEVSNALAARNLNFPGGIIKDKGKEFIIRTVKEFEQPKDINEVRVRSNDLGGSIKIKDLAFVKDDFELQTIIEKAYGNEAIILTALKKESGDAITLVEKVKKEIADFQKYAPAELSISTMNDLSFFVSRRLSVLSSNILYGMIFVILSLLVFLGWRISLMVALGIPFSFAITFLVMGSMDISINLISMFGLIIVSGMLVDDAIVVGENVYKKLEQGMPPLQAAIKGAQEMLVPVLGSVSTTMVAFLPLMMMSGIMGKFLWALPLSIIIALFASLLESFLILPSHLYDITKNAKKDALIKHDSSVETKIYNLLLKIYKPTLFWVVKNKYKTMGLVGLLFFFAMFLIGVTGFILFPKGGVETIFLKTEAPKGITLEEMNRRVEPLEAAIRDLGIKELDSYSTRIGIHQEQPNDPFTKRGKNYGQISVFLTPANARERQSQDIISYLTMKLDPVKPVQTVMSFDPVGQNLASITNDNFYTLLNLRNNQISKIKIANDYLIGAGQLKDQKIGYVNGLNQFGVSVPNGSSNKVLGVLKLEKLDFPKAFLVLPGTQKGILISQLNHSYMVDFANGTYSRSSDLRGSFTSIGAAGKNLIYITTDTGSFEIFSYDEKKFKSEFKITKAPKLIRKADGKVEYDFKSQVKLPRIESASISENGKFAYLAAFNGTIYTVDLSRKEISAALFTGDVPVYYAVNDAKKSDYFLVGKSKLLEVWNAKTQKKEFEQSVAGTISKHFYTQKGIVLYLTFNGIYETASFDRIQLRPIQKEQVMLEKIEFKQAAGGPPVGAPVQLEIKGDEFDDLKKISAIAKEKLSAMDGVYDVRDNWEEGNDEFRVEINEERASMAGTTVMQIASTIQMAFDGRVATSIKKSYEEIDIRVIFPEKLRENLATLKKVQIRNQIGNLVPITELADFKPAKGVSIITHTDYRRTIFVQANIDETKSTSLKVNNQIQEQLKPVLAGFPGYVVKASGEYEDTQESMSDLGRSFLFALLGIIAILVLIFGNFRQPIIIVSAIPLGFIGVSIAFFLHKITFWPDLTFSFLASFGIIGLAGVVVNDSIILVDYINKLVLAGYNRYNAITKGASERLRAVILTTVTTIFGVFPTAYGIGGEDPFLKPMALAMGWGLLFATGITLLVVPALFAIWENVVEVVQFRKTQTKLPTKLFMGIFIISCIFLFPLAMIYLFYHIHKFNKHQQTNLSPEADEDINEAMIG